MWMDLINENEENYEPNAPHSFLKRGQGQVLLTKSKSPNKSQTVNGKSPRKRLVKGEALTQQDKFDMFVDRMEGGTGGPYGNPQQQVENKKQSVYLSRPPRRSVMTLIQNKDLNMSSIGDTTGTSAKGEPDSPEMLKYKVKKIQKEKSLQQIHNWAVKLESKVKRRFTRQPGFKMIDDVERVE